MYQDQLQRPPSFQIQSNSPTMQQRPMQNIPQRFGLHQQSKLDTQNKFQQPQHFQLKQSIDVIKDSEKLNSDQQRISSLHSKLHKEAEKIHQWKNEKEMELNAKERNLQDAMKTIDSLRKSILELQFQNEELSTKLHEREMEKEETQHKIHTCREMANVLRGQIVDVEKRLAQAGLDKEAITQENQQHIEESHGLVLKFQEMDISLATIIEQQKTAMISLSEEHQDLTKQKQAQLHHLENQLVLLRQVEENHIQDIAASNAQLSENMVKIRNLQTELMESKSKLSDAEKSLQSQEETIAYLHTRFETVSEKLDTTGRHFEEAKLNWNEFSKQSEALKQQALEAEKRFNKEKKELQKNVEWLTALSEERGQSLSKMEEETRLAVENIQMKTLEASKQKEINDNLLKQIQDYRDKVESSVSDCKSVTSRLASAEAKIQEKENDLVALESVKVQFEKNLHEAKIMIESIEEDNRNLKNNLQLITDQLLSVQKNGDEKDSSIQKYVDLLNEMKVEKESLSRQISELLQKDQVLAELKRDNESLQENVKIASLTIQDHCAEKQKAEEDIKKLTNDLLSQTEKSKIQILELENGTKKVEELNCLLHQKEKELEDLKAVHEENAACFKKEIADHQSKAEMLAKKNKNIQSSMNVKAKIVKNMEKKDRTFKNEMNSKKERIAQLEKELSEMDKQCKDAVALSEKKAYELTNAKDSFEMQQKEFCFTIEKYKKDSDEIVGQHVKENETLKAQVEKIQLELSKQTDELKLQAAKSKEIQDESDGKIKAKEEQINQLEEVLRQTKQDLKKQEDTMEDYLAKLEKTQQELTDLKSLHTAKHLNRSPLVDFNYRDRLVPSAPQTPTSALKTPVTPQSQSKRGTRALAAGAEKENSADFSASDHAAPQFKNTSLASQTPIMQRVKSNVRFSPKTPSNLVKKEVKKEGLTPAVKTGERKNIKIVNQVDKMISGHYRASQSPKIEKRCKSMLLQKPSPGDVNKPKIFGNKKMSMPKPSSKAEPSKNTSWFDTDNVFGFED